MLGGYAGKILRVDLTTGETTEQPLDEGLLRRYIGGSGLGARFLYDETSAQADPLGPDNLLLFMTGPLAGTRVPTSDRFAVVARSPLTGIWGEADCGGRWASELKAAGYDGIVVSGQAADPVCLWVEDGRAELRQARHLWGQDTYELDLGDAQVVCIGPAGERLVRLAAIMHGGRSGRAAGRCGLGAVMGAKRLKAIAVKGTGRVAVADDERLAASVREMLPSIKEGASSQHEHGTSGGMVAIERLGDLPIENWRGGSWTQGAEATSGVRMTETILTGRYACGRCPISCGRVVKVTKGPYAGVEGAGPEYETASALGSLCLVDDLEAIAKANELCNRYGLDTISTGAVIAFAMEARQRGLLEEGPSWGDAQGLVELVHQIGRRQGLGQLLGQGVRRAAEELGGRALDFALHVKGLELPMHDPRAYNSVALGYATSNRGACHLQALSHVLERSATMPELGYDQAQDRFGVENKAEFVAKLQDLMCMFDSLKVCKFLLFGGVKLTPLIAWLNYVTGWDVDQDEFMTIGERLYNLKRTYNVRLGISRKDDWLPLRVLTHRRGEGGAAENLPPLGRMLADYYAYRGWDEEGIPTEAKLEELGLV